MPKDQNGRNVVGGDALALMGRDISPAAPSDGDTIVWDEDARQWVPGAPAGGGVSPGTVYEALLPLGKISDGPESYAGSVALFAPDSDVFTDGGYLFFRAARSGGVDDLNSIWEWSAGDQDNGEVYYSVNVYDGRPKTNASFVQTDFAAENLDYTHGYLAHGRAEINYGNGATTGFAEYVAESYTAGKVKMRVAADRAQLVIIAESGQTAPLFNLTGKPTGVAVTAGGIHAALVTLGLITA